MKEYKPLFELPVSKKISSLKISDKRVIEEILPQLKAVGLDCDLHTIKQLSENTVIRVQSKKTDKTLYMIPWVRVYDINKSYARILFEFPRINVPKSMKEDDSDTKLNYVKRIVEKYNIHFLVILITENTENRYWLGAYNDIPFKQWRTVYRYKNKKGDRIQFRHYNNYDFVYKTELKNKIFKKLGL